MVLSIPDIPERGMGLSSWDLVFITKALRFGFSVVSSYVIRVRISNLVSTSSGNIEIVYHKELNKSLIA